MLDLDNFYVPRLLLSFPTRAIYATILYTIIPNHFGLAFISSVRGVWVSSHPGKPPRIPEVSSRE